MKRIKNLLVVLLLSVIFIIPNQVYLSAQSPIGLVINGQTVTNLPMPPVIQDDRTLVPARAVFESLGATVNWNSAARTVHIQYRGVYIQLTIGSRDITVNGYTMQMPIPAQIINDNTMIPARAVSENLGFEVDFRNRTVFIDNPTANWPDILSISASTLHITPVFIITASAEITTLESSLLDDNRLIIDFPNTRTNLSGAVALPDNSPVLDIRVSQFSLNISRVVFELPDGLTYSIDKSTDGLTVTVTLHVDEGLYNGVSPDHSPTPLPPPVSSPTPIPVVSPTPAPSPSPMPPGNNQQVGFDATTRTIRIPKTAGFNINQVTRNNRYHNRQYVLTFPVDLSRYLSLGTTPISDTLLSSITVEQTAQGHTTLTLTGRQILAINIYEDDANHFIGIMCPREKYPRIVIIDPGHGGDRPGAVRDGVRAADLNLAVSRKLLQLMNTHGVMRGYTTRNTDISVDLRERALMANDIGDIMVTIHHNSWHTDNINGVETFYRTNSYDEGRSLTSRSLAAIMQSQLIEHTGRNSRGHRSGDYVVLRYTTIPAVLMEVGFMSNPQEFATLITQEYQWRVAQAIYDGLLEAFEIYEPSR